MYARLCRNRLFHLIPMAASIAVKASAHKGNAISMIMALLLVVFDFNAKFRALARHKSADGFSHINTGGKIPIVALNPSDKTTLWTCVLNNYCSHSYISQRTDIGSIEYTNYSQFPIIYYTTLYNILSSI